MKTIKNILIIGLSTIAISAGFSSCKTDQVDRSYSVIKDRNVPKNDFDKWLEANYLKEYNIDVKYKYEDIYADFNYHIAPASVEKSIQIANLVKYVCIEPYDIVTGSKEFIRKLFPKQLFIVGSSALNPNGTELLGVAEGGRAIKLYKVNSINPQSVSSLNEYFFHTIHHEFTHIQNQTKPYTPDFKQISGSLYVADSWANDDTYGKPENIKDQVINEYNTDDVKSFRTKLQRQSELTEKTDRTEEEETELTTLTREIEEFRANPAKMLQIQNYVLVSRTLRALTTAEVNALRKGFISPYSSKNDIEDFAELQAFYITDTPEVWHGKVLVAGRDGGNIIIQKMNIIKSYLKDDWGLDIDLLRDTVQDRIAHLDAININSVDIFN